MVHANMYIRTYIHAHVTRDNNSKGTFIQSITNNQPHLEPLVIHTVHTRARTHAHTHARTHTRTHTTVHTNQYIRITQYIHLHTY